MNYEQPSIERPQHTRVDAHDTIIHEVMVVDGDRARRTQVSDAFRAEGCHVVEVGTALEALHTLTRSSIPTVVFAVADTIPPNTGVHLRDYLDTTHAPALVVGVGDPEWIPTSARLDPSSTAAVIRARVKSILLMTRLDESGQA